MQLSSDQSDPNIDRPIKPELIARLSPFGLASTICPKAFATIEAGSDTTEENLNPLRCFDFDLEIAVVASATIFPTIPRPTFGDTSLTWTGQRNFQSAGSATAGGGDEETVRRRGL
jgi:hypothetical protein